MAFQARNGTCEMKSEHSGRILFGKFEMDWDLKWDENYSVLLRFLN